MIELESDIDPLRSLAIHDFSYSRLNTFEECALKYFYAYIIKAPQVFGHPATLGNIIHRALEVTIEDEEPISLQELLKNYKIARFEYDPDQDIPENMIENGERMLMEYVAAHSGPQHVTAKELNFSFILGRARFNGYIDYIAEYPSYVQMRDYKSGSREVAKKDLSTNLQLGIYSLYLQYIYPDKEIQAELYYLKSNRLKGHRFSSDDLSAIENNLLELTEKVLNTEDFQPTSNERNCYYCSYAQDGTCLTGSQRLHRRG